MPVPHPAPR